MVHGSSTSSHRNNTLLYAFAFVYLCALALLGVIAHRRKVKNSATAGGLEGHFGGSFSAPMLILTTFSTVYSGFTVTGIPSEAYRKGFFSLRWIGATLVIVIAMLLFYPRLRRLAVERHYQSPNDFVTDRYRSPGLRLLCAACAVVPLLIYMTAQVVSFAAMVSGLTSDAVPKWASMLGFALLTLILEKLGGMNSVVLTDAVQSIIMILAFLAVPWVLAARYGFLAEFASPGCDSLVYVQGNTSGNAVPAECPGPAGGAVATGCVPAGCIGAVQPEFYEYPGYEDQAQIFWFFFNMLAASLQPHMVQRAYIAESDKALKIVMAAMLVAPFLAQPPGIIIGLTKAAFDREWPALDRDATAFSGVSNQLAGVGPVEYLLVSTMTCSALAAIMSTADSALMGASSVLSIDVFKGWLMPSASNGLVLHVSEASSFFMMSGAVLLGLKLSVSQFGSLIVFQNGMLMQLLPTYGFGLYFDFEARSLIAGMAGGLLMLIILAAAGNPLDPYVPLVNVSFLTNFLVVGTAHFIFQLMGVGNKGAKVPLHQDDTIFSEQAPLSLTDIRAIMAPSSEPNRPVLAVMLILMVLAVPVYKSPGTPEEMFSGLPQWSLIQCLFFLAVLILGYFVVAGWSPEGRLSGGKKDRGSSDSSSCESSSDSC